MEIKEGWNNIFKITGVLNLDDGTIVLEKDGYILHLADSLAALNGKAVTIIVSNEVPQ